MSEQATSGRSGEGSSCSDSENDRLLDRLVRDTESERTRLARLSLRVTGIDTRPTVPRESLLDGFDRCIGGGDVSLGRLGRVVLLFKEERERDDAEACVITDLETGQRVRLQASVDEIGRRVNWRLAQGDVIPAILFRERPHLAHLTPFVEAVVRDERERRARVRQRRARRYN